MTDAWTNRREDVLASGADVAEQLRAVAQKAAPAAIGDDVLDQAVTALAGGFDSRNGGFGIAPKFPPSMVLEFLLRHQARVRDGRSLQMVDATCEAMARGGMYDQLAGGFARYSVDASWVVPHFEKMLYDNAQLLRVYLHLWRATGSPLAERVARETADFLLSDLRTPEGGFASALDADTEGVEGLTYAWTPAQLAEVLGEEDGARAATLLSVTPRGTFEHGTSTLQLRTDPADARLVAGGSGAAAGRPARPAAAGPRRQGHLVLERPGHRRPRRGRCPAGGAALPRRRPGVRRLPARRPRRRRPAAPVLPWRGRRCRRRRPGRPRQPGRGAAGAAPGRGRRPLAG